MPTRFRTSKRIRMLLGLLVSMSFLPVLACPEKATTPSREPEEAAEKPKVLLSDFDGEHAFAHVKKFVEMGPRPSGSPAIKQAQQYIESELKSSGLAVKTMPFVAQTPLGRKEMLNITGVIEGKKSDVIIISGHYDTKYFKEISFVGANDGGSSAGAVLELARVLAKGPKPELTIWFAFFDGEEAVIEWRGADNTYGSRQYAGELKKSGEINRVRALILLDMIGDRQLDIRKESGSTVWLTEIIWRTARELGYGRNFLQPDMPVEDDHANFLRAGVDSVDLIDFNYGPDNAYWHEASDTLDKVSAASLKIVGDTVVRSLPAITEHILKHSE